MIIEAKKLLLSDKPLTRKEERRVVAAVYLLCAIVSEEKNDVVFPLINFDGVNGALHQDWVATLAYILVTDPVVHLRIKQMPYDDIVCGQLVAIFHQAVEKLLTEHPLAPFLSAKDGAGQKLQQRNNGLSKKHD